MAWYNEVNEERSGDEPDKQNSDGANRAKGGGSFGPGAVPPWVQAASLPDADNQPGPPPAARQAVPAQPPPAPAPTPKPPDPPAPAPSAIEPAVSRPEAPSAPPSVAPPTQPTTPPSVAAPMSVVPTSPVPGAPRPAPRVVTYGQPVSAAAPPVAEMPPPVTATTTAVNPATVASQPPPGRSAVAEALVPQASIGSNLLSPHPTTGLESDDSEELPGNSVTVGDGSGPTVQAQAAPGPLSFQASAWEYFGVCVLSFLLFLIPIFGWAGQWLIMNRFIIEHLRVEGRPLKYTMTYGYALKTILGNLLMLVVTLGFGLYWLHVKQFTAIFAHAQYADEVEP